MTANPGDLLPAAKEFAKRLADEEAEKATIAARKHAAAEAEKIALIDKMQRPSGLSDEEAIQRAIRIIENAVSGGRTEVQVYRFPNRLCTDRGRAINQGEPGWEETLTGVPKEIYQLWHRHFQQRGYKLRVQIIDFPDGMPGDIGMTLSWC
jgi:hypothetical protein